MSQFDDLERAVGRNMPSLPADVRKVKQWLEQWEQRAGKIYQQDKQTIAKCFHEARNHFGASLISQTVR